MDILFSVLHPFFETAVQVSCGFPGIDNHENTAMHLELFPAEIRRLCIVIAVREIFQFRPLKYRKVLMIVSGHALLCIQQNGIFLLFQQWLCRRTKHHCTAADTGQKVHRQVEQIGTFQRNGLHLVDEQHRTAKPVHPAHRSVLAVKQCLQKLHLRRGKNRHIPFFRAQLILAQFLFPFLAVIKDHVGVMLQKILRPGNFPEILAVLFENGHKRRCVHDFLDAVFRTHCIANGKSQR